MSTSPSNSRDPHLRHARWPADEAAIRDIREEVFIAEQGVPAALEWDGRDPECTHLLAFSEQGEPVATARMTPGGHIGRMAVRKAWRGQGIGSRLLKSLLDAARAQGLAAVYLNAQTHALPFYAHHGFQAEGVEFLDAEIPHRRMRLSLEPKGGQD